MYTKLYGSQISASDLLLTYKGQKLTKKEKREFVNKAFEIILSDIIENDTHFNLPTTGGYKASIFLNPIEGEDFKQIYKKGGFNWVDWFLTNFTAYELKFITEKNNSYKEIRFRVSGTLLDKLIKTTYDKSLVK